MADYIRNFTNLLFENFKQFLELDWNKIRYLNTELAFLLGYILLAVVGLKTMLPLFLRSKYSREDAGDSEFEKNPQSFFAKFFLFSPKLTALFLITLFLTALAGPYHNQITESEEIIESRIRIDLRDTSTSMTSPFLDTQISKAEIAANSHLEFIKMRKGKKDFVTFWEFASVPHMIQEFMIDEDELYFLQVYDAPWIITEDCFYYPRIPWGRCAKIRGDSGGTAIVEALQQIIKYVDENENVKNAKVKSILVISDADVYEFPEAELKEFQRRNIVPYLILIVDLPAGDDDFYPEALHYNNESSYQSGPQIPELARRISQFGGKYFDIRSPDALKAAFAEIDKLETVATKINKSETRKDLFQLYLSVALSGIFVVMILGLMVVMFLPQYP